MSSYFPFMLDVLGEILSRGSLFLLSITIITHASRKVVQEEKELSSQTPENVQMLTWCHVIAFPFIGSAMLLIMFYLFDYIQFIFTIVTVGLSIATLFSFIHPFIQQIIINYKRESPNRSLFFNWNTFLTSICSVVLTILWVLTGYWVLLDLLGVAIAIFMIQFVRIPSLKLASLLLIFLLLYDVFWVFLSSSFFNANVMVEVAVKKAKNPVAIVAEKLNMPDIAKSQPPLSLPGKLLVPSSFTEDYYSMLGLGDVVLPGLLLCLAMRFDNQGHISILNSGTSCLLKCQKWTYFSVTLLGYSLASLRCTEEWFQNSSCQMLYNTKSLCTAGLMVEIMRYPQPALLYLVPGVLIPFICKAYIQGHLRVLWHGPFSTDTPHNSGYQKMSV